MRRESEIERERSLSRRRPVSHSHRPLFLKSRSLRFEVKEGRAREREREREGGGRGEREFDNIEPEQDFEPAFTRRNAVRWPVPRPRLRRPSCVRTSRVTVKKSQLSGRKREKRDPKHMRLVSKSYHEKGAARAIYRFTPQPSSRAMT